MEHSRASSCPSLAHQLVGTKKMQQVLAREGMVERYMSIGVISYYEHVPWPGCAILFFSRIEMSAWWWKASHFTEFLYACLCAYMHVYFGKGGVGSFVGLVIIMITKINFTRRFITDASAAAKIRSTFAGLYSLELVSDWSESAFLWTYTWESCLVWIRSKWPWKLEHLHTSMLSSVLQLKLNNSIPLATDAPCAVQSMWSTRSGTYFDH